MKELIDEKSFAMALAVLAGLLFVAGIGVLFLARRHRSVGLGLTVVGPALWLLWLAYGGVVQHFGLDSVKGLGVNLLVFIVAGAAVGALLGLRQRRKTE